MRNSTLHRAAVVVWPLGFRLTVGRVFMVFTLLLNIYTTGTRRASAIGCTTNGSLCQNVAQGLPCHRVIAPCNIRIAFTGAIRVVFPTTIHCISLKDGRVVTNGTSNTRGMVQIGTAARNFPNRAGFSIVYRSNDFFSFGTGCTHRPRVLGVRVGSFLRGRSASSFSRAHVGVCFQRLNGRDPLLIGLVVRDVCGGGSQGIHRLNDGHFKVRFLVGKVCACGKVLCMRARAGGDSGIPFSASFVEFGVASGGIPGHATVRRAMLSTMHDCGRIVRVTKGSAIHAICTLPGFAVPSSGLLIIRLCRGGNKQRRAVQIRGTSVIGTRIVSRLGVG